MPYFIWRGIDQEGSFCNGYTFARSDQELLLIIQEQQIDITHYAPQRFFFKRTISLQTRVSIFKQLAILLDAGILLPNAFSLLINQTSRRDYYVREMLYTILADIHNGISCADAFGAYRSIFGNLTIALIHAGEETGQLAAVLHMMSVYWDDRLRLRKQIRSALMVPTITIICFFIVLFLLFYWVVPLFATIFANSNKPLPWMTATILTISTYVQTMGIMQLFGIALVGTGLYGLLILNERIHYYVDIVRLQIPLFGTITQLSTSLGIAQSLAILVKGGVPLVYALQLTREVIDNKRLIRTWDTITAAVEDGMPLSDALARYGSHYFRGEVIALIALGEEAEQLDLLLSRLTVLLKERLHTITQLLTQLVQPFCMIILGCLIAFLIVAIYMPLFDISDMISTW